MVFMEVIRFKLKLNVVSVQQGPVQLIMKLTGFSLNCIALFLKVPKAFFTVITSLPSGFLPRSL